MSQISVPDLTLEATGGRTINLKEHKTFVLYFYPEDSTPGCTQEGKDFARLYKDIKELQCEVFGVSKDSLKSHENFKSKYHYPFELISDPEGKLCEAFKVLKKKTLFGKGFLGIERSTFVIDKGAVVKEWRQVKVTGHGDEVFEHLKTLKN